MDALDTLAHSTVPAAMGEARIGIDEFIAACNAGERDLLDIHVPEEAAVRQFNGGLLGLADRLEGGAARSLDLRT